MPLSRSASQEMACTLELGSFTWRITDWASKANDEVVESETFTVGGMRWCVASPQGCRPGAVRLARPPYLLRVCSLPALRHACRYLALLPQGDEYEDACGHLSVFLHSQEDAANLETLHSCTFSLILRAGSGADVRYQGACAHLQRVRGTHAGPQPQPRCISSRTTLRAGACLFFSFFEARFLADLLLH